MTQPLHSSLRPAARPAPGRTAPKIAARAVWLALALVQLGAALPAGAAEPAASDGPVSAVPQYEANSASQADLERVRGVGPGLSEAILAARGQAPFVNWNDFIHRLSGIGPTRAWHLSMAGLRVAGQAYGPGSTASSTSTGTPSVPAARPKPTAATTGPASGR